MKLNLPLIGTIDPKLNVRGHLRSWLRIAVPLLPLAAVFGFGVWISLHFGRIGFMPLDDSIVFDGAWRLLGGQVPYRDFTLPAGLTPALIQAVLFRLLGVTWFSYCLHAAIFNGLFSLLVYSFLRLLGGGRAVALVYAALSAVVFYPPIGVPYLEQHSFFFAFAALVALLAAERRGRRAAAALGGAAALALGAAVLSKHIPAALVLPLCAVAVLRLDGERRRAAIGGLLAGAAAGGLALAGLSLLLGVRWDLMAGSLWSAPRLLGSLRWAELGRDPGHGRAVWNVLTGWQLASAPAILGAGAVVAGWAAWRWRRRRPARMDPSVRGALLGAILSVGLFLACLLFAALTFHSTWSGLAYLFAALGGVHVAALRALGAERSPGTLGGEEPPRTLLVDEPPRASDAERSPGTFVRAQGGAARVVATAFLLIAGFDAWRFQRNVNATGIAHVAGREGIATAAGVDLPTQLSFLRWATPAWASYSAQDLNRLVAFFAVHDGNFFLLGDSSILYALTGRPSLSPVLWFHPALTLPLPRHADLEDFEQRILARLRSYGARYVVLESAHTEMGVSLDWFPRLRRRVRRHTCARQQIGPFAVLTLCPGVWDQPEGNSRAFGGG